MVEPELATTSPFSRSHGRAQTHYDESFPLADTIKLEPDTISLSLAYAVELKLISMGPFLPLMWSAITCYDGSLLPLM